MLTTIRGLIVREIPVGDTSKYIHVLTAERGKISVMVQGVGKLHGKFTSSTQVFCYSELVLYEKGDKLYLNEATLIENYFYLCKDYALVTLGTYLLNVAEYVSNEEQADDGILRLTLNSLWYLTHKKPSDLRLVKGTFELRMAAIIGYAPNVIGCHDCGCRISDSDMFLNVMDGCLTCRSCTEQRRLHSHEDYDRRIVDDDRTAQILIPLDAAVICAMQYVLLSDLNRIFSFSLAGTLIPQFADACEKYLTNHIDHRFAVLDMMIF